MVNRRKISEELIDKLLFETNRTCCICTTPGKDVQIHHIDQISSNNEYDNLVVLCLSCHSDVHTKRGFGRNWTYGQIQRHKNEWIERVKLRKQEADKLASIQFVTGDLQNSTHDFENLDYKEIDDPILTRYLEKILIIHKAQKDAAQIDFDTGVTMDSVEACLKLIDFYAAVLVELSTFYPKGHFQEKHPRIFFDEQIATRGLFQGHATRPECEGFIPSMHRQFMYYRFMLDVRRMVRDVAVCLMEMSSFFEPGDRKWADNWMEE